MDHGNLGCTGAALDVTSLGDARYAMRVQTGTGSVVPIGITPKFVMVPPALELVIVRDMWLTGFDAPSMHTMYIDKPMKGHGLMQAIARVNRVFRTSLPASSSIISASPRTSKTPSASIPPPISARPESTRPKRSQCFLRNTRS